MAERYAELLDDVAARVANMARYVPSVNETEARDFGRRVADMLAEEWGGSSVYIPKNLASRFRRRDAELYRAFTGHNIEELARKIRPDAAARLFHHKSGACPARPFTAHLSRPARHVFLKPFQRHSSRP